MAQQVEPVFNTEDDAINYTTKLRVDLVGEITKDGIPKDDDAQRMILSALDGIDRTALATMRIKAEAQIAKGNNQSAANVAAILMQLRPTDGQVLIEGIEPPVLPSHIPDPELIEGELGAAGESTLNYADFMKKTAS